MSAKKEEISFCNSIFLVLINTSHNLFNPIISLCEVLFTLNSLLFIRIKTPFEILISFINFLNKLNEYKSSIANNFSFKNTFLNNVLRN